MSSFPTISYDESMGTADAADAADFEAFPLTASGNDVTMVQSEPVPKAPIQMPQLKIKTLTSTKATKGSSAKFLPKFEKIEKELATVISMVPSDNKKWKDMKDSVNMVDEMNNTPATAPVAIPRSRSDILEEDGSLFLFWIDAYEKVGSIYVFGKVP
jgi:hypothetical protein